MADSALVYHAKGVPGSILVGTKIFTLVSPLGKSQQLSENIVAHRNTKKKRRSEPTLKLYARGNWIISASHNMREM